MNQAREYTAEELRQLERETWSEKTFTAKVIELARGYGWKVAHFRPARTAKGWRTAVQGDGAGFPDLVLVKKFVVFAELKTATGKPSEEQMEWKRRLQVAGELAYTWRPSDWPYICRILGEDVP
jgi:hypothetical protein